LDFRAEYNNDKESHACTTRRLVDAMGVERVIPLGVRSMSREEADMAEKMELPYVTSWEVKAGIDDVVDFIPFTHVYLSVDMDVFDPSYAPGVGNPEPFGLSDFEVFEVVRRIAPRIIGMDVVEMSPPHDDGRTALLAAKMIMDCISWASAH
jgi:arginase family enzyme